MSEKFMVGKDENIGKGEFANMPKDVYMREYPKEKRAPEGMIDDTMDDIDEIQDHSESQRRRYMSHQK